MIGSLTIENDKIKETVSGYKPPKEVVDLTLMITPDYQMGVDIQNRPFEEFNDLSFIERLNSDQKAFNGHVPQGSSDPDEEWRFDGTRLITRNKIISIAAHLVASMMYPGIFAQNDKDEEDKEMAEIMRYVIEWCIKNSDYEMAFFYGVIAALFRPVAYIEVGFIEVMQTIRQRMNDGTITKKEVIDEVLSGLKYFNVPPQEILITNAYQFEIQKQKAIFRDRFISYDEAQALFGTHPDFQYVKAGVNLIFNSLDNTFYEKEEPEWKGLCKYTIYYNRRKDLEVPYINGVYLGKSNVEANRIKHRDNKDRPKYRYVKFGAEPIDERHFYFYKSIAFKLLNDQNIADRMWKMVMDGTFLEVMTPMAVIGDKAIGADIMFPGSVTNFPKDTTITEIGKGRNLAAGWGALGQIEKSMSESSQDDQRAGISEGEGKTAYEVAKIEQNARINLGIIGKMLVKLVKDLGDLTIDKIVSNYTVGEIEELLGGNLKMKYRTFLLPDEKEGGRKVTRKITFDGSLIGKKMTEEEKLKDSYSMLKAEGNKLESETILYRVNPVKFSRLKYLITIEPESWMPKNDRFDALMKLEAYDRLIKNPLVDQEAVTRDFLLEPLTKGEADKYMRKDLPEGMDISQLFGNNPQPNKESVMSGAGQTPSNNILE